MCKKAIDYDHKYFIHIIDQCQEICEYAINKNYLLLEHIKTRRNRMCLERVFAVMCCSESNVVTINGDILHCYIKYGINFSYCIVK